MVPRLRVNRLRAILPASGPKTGQLEHERVLDLGDPAGVLDLRPDRRRATIDDHEERGAPTLRTSDRNTRNCVGAGSSPPEVGEQPGEDRDDEQQHADDREDRHDEDDDRVGHRGLDLAAELDLGLEVGRDRQQRLVEEPADLAGPAHVDHQRREDLRVLGHGRRTASCRSRRRSGPRARTLASVLFWVWSARMVSARSSDSPELIIVANCRDMTARSLSLTPLPHGQRDLRVHAAAGLPDAHRGVAHRLELGDEHGLVRGVELARGQLPGAVADAVLVASWSQPS